MKLAVITPVGPGHEKFVDDCRASVNAAIEYDPGPFTSITHRIIDDTKGAMGRSHARNIGMDGDADWLFFLDADDVMCVDALTRNDTSVDATFGLVMTHKITGRMRRLNVHPCGWRELGLYGARGTLAMGFFVRASVARALRFNESMNIAEDYDFYIRLPSFTKVKHPLVKIGYHLPSAGGPRGYDEIDWIGSCNKLILEDVKRSPEKYDLGDHAVLESARRTPRQRREVLRSLREKFDRGER